jgi:DNA-binding transcriptional LysR family regulator
MTRPSLVELEAVATIARRGSFRAAALELGMSSTAVSHAVAGLEARLGVRLFNRTTRSVSLTAAGEQFLAQVAPALADIRAAVEGVNAHRETPTGTLRLNTSVGAARQILGPLILEYMARYPDMRVDIVTEGALVDIVKGGFDAGFRLAEFVPQDMIAVPLGPEQRSVVVGSPDYFARHPAPQTPEDLRRHRCIRARMASGKIYRWEFEQRGEVMEIDVDGPLTLDESTVMRQAALAGVGLSYLSIWDVADDIAQGRLVAALEDWSPPYPGLCLYYPGRRHAPAGLRAFIDLIREVRARPR